MDVEEKKGVVESCVLIVSGNEKTRGIISTVSNEILSFFGYKAREVIGQSIDILMPKYYAEKHDTFMKKYFVTGEGNVINKVRCVYP